MYKEIETLLYLSKKGDIKAREKLLIKLNPLIISSIRRYYNKVHLYDDLIQEGYETILRAIDDYNPDKGAYFLGYIKTMLKYNYLNKHRQKQHISLNKPIEANGAELIDLIEGDEKQPIDRIIEVEENKSLLKALDHLTKRQREIIVLFYIKEYTIGSIADRLGVSYRTVVNTKTTALNKLKNIIVK